MKVFFAVFFLLLPFSLHAETEAVSTPADSAAAPSRPVGKIGCNDLLAKVLKDYNFGEIDLASKKIKGSADSRLRASPRNGVLLIAAAKENSPGPLSVIYPAVNADGVKMPAINGRVGTPRIRSMAMDDGFDIEMFAGGNKFVIKSKIGGARPDGQPSCTVASVQAKVASRDDEAEAEEKNVRKSQGITDKVEPIAKFTEQKLSAEDCRGFEAKMYDHAGNRAIAKMCKFLSDKF